MDSKMMSLHSKRMEQTIIEISAMLTDAIEMTQRAIAIASDSEKALANIQETLEELFINLDDVVADKE